jgi:hypothetical protein
MKNILLIYFITCSFINIHAQVTNGLIAYYSFNGDAKDKSGNHNHGSINGGVSLTADRFEIPDNAYLFDGTNNYILANNSASLESPGTTNAITQAAWIYFIGPVIGGDHWCSIIMKTNQTDNHFMYRITVNLDGGISTAFNNYNNGHGIAYSFNLNTWYFIASTFDGTTLKTYANGSLIDSAAFSTTITTNQMPLTIGADFVGDQEFFNGKIDEVRIYNRALSDTEIGALYKNGCVKPKGLKVVNITSVSAKLKWNTVPGAVGYHISRRKKGNVNYTVLDVTDTSKIIKHLKTKTTYEWNVQSICSYSPLILSDTAKGKDFTTASSFISDIDETESLKINNQLNVTLSPNPAKSTASLSIGGNKPVSILITDMSGKVLWNKENISERKIVLPVQNFSNGTYIIVVNNNEQKKTLKLVKMQ